MSRILLKAATLINEGTERVADVLIENGRIAKIGTDLSVEGKVDERDCSGLLLLPGCIDDQVHFREPGLTHKGTIASESRAAVAGGITSFIRSEEHTSELQSHVNLVCRLLLEKK